MAKLWVLGSPACDIVFQLKCMPAPGDLAGGRWLGERPGGSSANIARALSSAGHDVGMIGWLGNDVRGNRLVEDLERWEVNTQYIARAETCTPKALIFLDEDGERTIVVVSSGIVPELKVPYSELSSADCVFIWDYHVCDEQVVACLRDSQALVVSSVPPSESGQKWMAHVIIGSAAQYPDPWLEAPFERAREAVGPELQWVIVTHGEQGATAYGVGGIVHIPAVPVHQVDTTGGGDAFAAGVVHGLLDGRDILEAGVLGARWGAEAVRRVQSVPPSWEEVFPGKE